MKYIDLLQMYANGEELLKKIKIKNMIFVLEHLTDEDYEEGLYYIHDDMLISIPSRTLLKLEVDKVDKDDKII